MASQCHLVFPKLLSLHSWWGGPPGPQPTPTSACWVWMNLISLARSGSRGTRADQGICPTTASGSPVLGKLSDIGRKRLRHVIGKVSGLGGIDPAPGATLGDCGNIGSAGDLDLGPFLGPRRWAGCRCWLDLSPILRGLDAAGNSGPGLAWDLGPFGGFGLLRRALWLAWGLVRQF